ncbi:Ig-like domain-containing protein [Lysinibacillus antri]|uniref:SbsA Ig-like domain-containing protein n=1 Tax=Lysinibacillus antri TaxID=2498145 RepID=A0A3S0RVP6_9BACI|nr:Ig-like domain-containing protein [Lysinibacillus antri]RUL52207.1 hypothetical protein EK386_10170 [Lysinibacillus antri]
MKKFVLTVAACVAIGGVGSTGSVYAAPKDEVKQENVQQQKEKQQEKKQENQNKGQLNQLKSIDKQLDKIEEKLKFYKDKLPKLETPIDELVEEEVEDVKAEEPASTDETSAPASTDETFNSDQTEALEESDGVKDSEAEKETQTEAPIQEDATQAPEATEDTEEEVEVDVEAELKQFPGYEGKFNALLNRLEAVTKRLDNLSKQGNASEALQERTQRLNSLKSEIETAITSLQSIQNKVKEEVNSDTKAEEKEVEEAVEENKDWTIQFSKGLDISTLSNLDIVVLDDEQNLVETTISYLKETNSVKISSAQPYESGKTYTLYIGNDISSENGLNLKNSVKMPFTIK